MFSVFIQPIFFFSNSRKSNYFGPKAHSPGSWAGRARAMGLRPGPPGAQGSQPAVVVCWAGPTPSAGVVIWFWDSRTGFCRWFSIQMTKKPTVKPHDVRLIKIYAIMLT